MIIAVAFFLSSQSPKGTVIALMRCAYMFCKILRRRDLEYIANTKSDALPFSNFNANCYFYLNKPPNTVKIYNVSKYFV